MQLICLELSHWHCPVSIRELFSFSAEQAQTFYRSSAFTESPFNEAEILSTCNRTEFIAACDEDDATTDSLKKEAATLIANFHGVDVETLLKYASWHSGAAAVEHLCRVAAGLESQVLGEAQILGQMTQAHQHASAVGTTGNVLKPVLDTAIRSGKRARTETSINRHAVSLGTVTARLAHQALHSLRDKESVVIGAGAMGQVVVHALAREGAQALTLLNRTPANAQPLVDKFGLVSHGLGALDAALKTADLIVTATSAPVYIITEQQLAAACADRHKPLLLLDLAVPRNIEPSAGNVSGVTLYDMDYLNDKRDGAIELRRRVVPVVEAIIASEAARCVRTLEQLETEKTIGMLRQHAEQIRQQELARVLKHLPQAEDPLREQLHNFSRSLVNKLLHEPTKQLRQSACTEQAEQYDALLKDLFQL